MAIDPLMPLQILKPGFFGNGTMYQAKGRWREGNFVRFHEGTIQPIGGWVQQGLTGDTIVGTPHAALCWQASDATPYIALGTTHGLYVIDDNNVVYDITPDPADIPAPIYDWQLTNFGAYLIATNSLRGDQDLSLVNVYTWIGVTADPAVPAWTTAVGPRGAYACFATPERQLVVLRGKDPTDRPARTGVDTIYSERRVFTSTTEELDGFVSSDTNEGGDFDLQTPGRCMTGTQGKGESLVWTDTDLWKMTFIGGELVYSYQKAGDDCGIVSKRAFVQIDKGAYWMSRGKFYVYNGFTQSIPCEVTDAVFGDFNESRAHTVWCVSNARYNEITWFYPSAGAPVPDRYVTYNHVENHWVHGRLDRTAGVQKRFNSDVIDEVKPAFFDASGNLFEHESGDERDALAWLASGPIEHGNGDQLMRINGIMDDTDVAGNVQLRIYTAMAADSLESDNGPYTLGPITNLRLKARQIRLRIEEAEQTSWRVGSPRLIMRPVERRGTGPGTADLVAASLEIIPPEVTLIQAQHYTFESIVRNAAGQVLDIDPDTWTSSNDDEIPVNQRGTVTALASPSTTNIQAFITSPALASNIAIVNVEADDDGVTVEITPTAADLTPGETVQLTAVVRNTAGQILVGYPIDSWTSNSAHATVDSTGLVTGVSTGVADIQAHITSPTAGTVDSNFSVITVTDPFVTHTFIGPADDHFVVTSGSGNVEVLIVGGGGSGGSVDGTGVGTGGGGAGGVVHLAAQAVAVGSYHVVAGGGGAGPDAEATVAPVVNGNDGEDSSFNDANTAFGGGGGGAGTVDHYAFATPVYNRGGNSGGSGGGGAAVSDSTAVGFGGGTGVGGQGNPGGSGTGDSGVIAAGGGGAGGVGHDAGSGSGGSGLAFTTSGTSTTYAVGGPGGSAAGGGGTGLAGADGFGNGGGGTGGARGSRGGNGGSGVVIIRYLVSTGIVATGGVKVVHN